MQSTIPTAEVHATTGALMTSGSTITVPTVKATVVTTEAAAASAARTYRGDDFLKHLITNNYNQNLLSNIEQSVNKILDIISEYEYEYEYRNREEDPNFEYYHQHQHQHHEQIGGDDQRGVMISTSVESTKAMKELGLLVGRKSSFVQDKVINGKEIAKQIFEEIKIEVEILKRVYGKVPSLAVVMVGDRMDSKIYVEQKRQKAAYLGFDFKLFSFPTTAKEIEVIDKINELNDDDQINGILLQLPLPDEMNSVEITSKICVRKDVDGFHVENIGQLATRGKYPKFVPCTAYGCLELLNRLQIGVEGKEVVIVGRSNIVGTPLALLLLQNNATVTVCHSKTKHLDQIINNAEILFVAIGKPMFIKGEWIKEGAVVIDVGINTVEDPTSPRGWKLVGDVDFDSATHKVHCITPVPGGVGPMTVAMLMKNTLNATWMQVAGSIPTALSLKSPTIKL